MNLKKTVAIATVVGALAAVSVPAFAFENEFHGMYRLRGMMSNYTNDAGGVLHAGTTLDPAPTLTVFEQRARLQYIAKTSDDLKLVTHFEIDSSWGDTAYQNGRGMGGAQGADTVNLETKQVYLDFNESLAGTNMKVGIMPVTDAYKGVLIVDDMGGILVSKKIDALTLAGGFFRLQDFNRTSSTGTVAGGIALETAKPIGRKNIDLYILDAKFAVSKDLTVGGAYYLISRDDQFNAQNMHVIGGNVAAKFGIITADAFLAYQTGDAILATTKQDLSAFAAQAAITANLGAAGTVRGNFLYTSGDDHAANSKNNDSWQSIPSGDAMTTSSNSYYDSKMKLLMRNVVNMDTDKALVMYTNNNNRGLVLGTLGYDMKLNDKLGASFNVGFAGVAEKRTANSAYIGTELNAQVDYKLFSNLTASLEGAYVKLGDGMNKQVLVPATQLLPGGKVNADDPYMTALMFNYTF
jgi:hypothetical protein